MEVFQNTKVDWLSSWLLLQTNSAICSFEVQYLYWKTCHHMLEKISSMRQISSFCYMEHWNSHSFKKKYLQKANSTMMSPIGETTKLSTECILVSMSSSFRFKFELLWFYVIFCKNLCFSSLNDLAHAPAVFFKKKLLLLNSRK